jgi:hypothetical protein
VARKAALFSFITARTVEHSRFNRPRAHDVDPNTGSGELDGRRLRDAFDRMLAAHIDRRGRTAGLA